MKQFLLAGLFLIGYLLLIKKLVKGKFWWLSAFLLLLSPWFIQLLISGFEFWWTKTLSFNLYNILNNLITNSSVDYLFFQGDPRIGFGTQETGPFYIYQIPLILIGFYSLFNKLGLYQKILLAWFVVGFVFASLFFSPDFSNCLFYFLPLQIISFLGLLKLFKFWQKGKAFSRVLLLFFTFMSFYEMIIFFHILVVHYPQRLLIK